MEEWDVDEVCVWLNAIGLGAKAGPFRDEAVDGALLVDLTEKELQDDLYLTKLQIKKYCQNLELAQREIKASRDPAASENLGEKVKILELKVSDLEAQLEEKNATIKELEDKKLELDASSAAVASAAASEPSIRVPPQASAAPPARASAAAPSPAAAAPPPPPPPKSNPPKKPPPKEEKPGVKGRPVLGGAAKGAAAGAVGGAVFGAVSDDMDAGEGAAAGAAAGAAVGACKGLRDRRQQQGKKVLFGGPGKGWLS